jgi:hypothetical protein
VKFWGPQPRPLRASQEAAAGAIEWAQPWADGIARVGYLAKGAVLLMVGGLALFAAMRLGGKATDPSGALLEVGRNPMGRAALVAIAVGSLAHALFRGALAVVGEPYARKWRDGRGQVTRRIAYVGSAMFYVGLAGTAAALGLGWRAIGHDGGDVEARRGAGQVLQLPFGRILLGGIAAAIVIVALVCVVRAFGRNDVRERLRVDVMTEAQCQLMTILGRVAYLARAIVLGITAYFLARSAYYDAPHAARGSGGALRAVAAQKHGHLLLGVVAVGLIAFGVYVLLEARWRRMFGR